MLPHFGIHVKEATNHKGMRLTTSLNDLCMSTPAHIKCIGSDKSRQLLVQYTDYNSASSSSVLIGSTGGQFLTWGDFDI
jgi:hypothetical protein